MLKDNNYFPYITKPIESEFCLKLTSEKAISLCGIVYIDNNPKTVSDLIGDGK